MPETRKEAMLASCTTIIATLDTLEAKVMDANTSEDVIVLLSKEESVTLNAELELKWLQGQLKTKGDR